MRTHTSKQTYSPPTDSTDDDRLYPAERAYGPRRRRPAWRRPAPDLSAGYVEVHLALHAADGISPEEVTSS